MDYVGDQSINRLLRAGVVIYQWDAIKGVACACTRNIERLKNRLEYINANILYIIPMKDRDGAARRAWRGLMKLTHPKFVFGYTFYFDLNDEIRSLLDTLPSFDPKSVQNGLKRLVLDTISAIAKEKKCIRVGEIVDRTLKFVNGLEIEKYLIWLSQDGLITYKASNNLFNNIVKLK